MLIVTIPIKITYQSNFKDHIKMYCVNTKNKRTMHMNENYVHISDLKTNLIKSSNSILLVKTIRMMF